MERELFEGLRIKLYSTDAGGLGALNSVLHLHATHHVWLSTAPKSYCVEEVTKAKALRFFGMANSTRDVQHLFGELTSPILVRWARTFRYSLRVGKDQEEWAMRLFRF